MLTTLRVAFAAAALLAPAFAAAQGKTPCTQIVFAGEVGAGEKFTREIGNQLTFRMDPWKEGSGWEFEIGPTNPAPNEWDRYIYTLTPPLRSSGPRDINTGWGTTAQDAVSRSHDFSFLLRRADSKRATDALDRVLWPKSDAHQENGLKVLQGLPRGRGEVQILDSRITRGTPVPGYGDCEQGKCGAIHWIKFRVKLTVPRSFQPAAGAEAVSVPCPDFSNS